MIYGSKSNVMHSELVLCETFAEKLLSQNRTMSMLTDMYMLRNVFNVTIFLFKSLECSVILTIPVEVTCGDCRHVVCSVDCICSAVLWIH